MNQQLKLYYTRKRRRDEENADKLKQQKNEMKNESEPDAELGTFQTKLTDVNNDCLEKVFMLLSLDDLLNIAHTNKGLKTAADMAFARKFGKKHFNFLIETYHRNGTLDSEGELINIRYLKTALRLLRCYGHLMADISIRCRNDNSKESKVLCYSNEYCAKSLKKMSLCGLSQQAFQTYIEKPFLLAETVYIDGDHFEKKLPKLNVWFSAVCCLSIYGLNVPDCSFLEAYFPLLEQLDINGYVKSKENYESLMKIFQLNPQLRRVSLDLVESPKPLQSASQYLPLLEELIVHDYADKPFNHNPIHFKSVKKLELNYWRYYAQRGLPRINLSFDQLEEVEMNLFFYGVNYEVVDFFMKHQSIKKLSLTSLAKADSSKTNILRIVSALPLLTDIDFPNRPYFSVDEIIDLLAESPSAKNFCCIISSAEEFIRIKTKLGGEWKASIDGRRVELKR